MAKKTIKTGGVPHIGAALAQSLTESIAEIIHNGINHHWFSEEDAKSATSQCYEKLTKILQKYTPVAYRVLDNALIVNGTPLKEKTRHIESLVNQLDALSVDNFTIHAGITEENFSNLLEVMEAQPAELQLLGGFVNCIKDFNIKGVEAKSLVFQEMSDDEVVLSKDDAAKVGTGSGAGEGGEDAAATILAFLKGDVALDDKDVAKTVKDTANDASKMADLILRAAEVQQSQTGLEGGESMIDFVVGCLRRTYVGLTKDRSAKTQIGKKRIAKNLMLLEKEVLERMRSMTADWNDDDLNAIIEATQEMTDELKIDSIVDDFAAKRRAEAESKRQIIEYIESVGIDNVDKLKQRLAERGFSSKEWQELLIQRGLAEGGGSGSGSGAGAGSEGSGPGDGGAPGATQGLGAGAGLGMGAGFSLGSLVEAISRLDILLGNMESSFDEDGPRTAPASSGKGAGEGAGQGAGEGAGQGAGEGAGQGAGEGDGQGGGDGDGVGEGAGKAREVMAEARANIRGLIDNIRDGADIFQSPKGSEGKPAKKKDIIRDLAAILEQIGQPLEAIRLSLDMVHGGNLGKLNQGQKGMLALALDNIDSIETLLEGAGPSS